MRAIKNTGSRTPWSLEEVDAAIVLYNHFLFHQRAGNPTPKAPAVRVLVDQIGRTKGSIEAKLMNISSARVLKGWDTVKGYKPLSNGQKLLIERVHALNVKEEG